MRKKLQRGLCLILCVVMAFSCMAFPAGAVVISPAIATVAKEIGTAVLTWFGSKVVEESLQALADWITGKTTDTDGLIAHIGALRTAQKTEVTEERLRELAYEWNTTCSDAVGFTVDVVDQRLDTGEVYRVIAVRRGYVVTTDAVQYCLADGISRILYCDATTELSGRWVPEDDTRGRHLLDYNDLFNLSQDVGGLLRIKDGFYEIYKRDGTLYCNVSGRRFSCIYKADQTAINQDRPTTGGTVIEGDTVTNIENNDTTINNDYSQDIDIEDMTQVLPGGTQNVIDNLIYDDNTKTYYIDSHDTTNNVTNNYLYQYHINYTSITYIGQSEEYNKRYELFYQLPDGRDSAELTREELEQLNVDIDVIPYVRSTDNVDVRSLYHFDADTRDSSYWNYITEFEWITGASLTYMESGAFEGALYLDENQHAFRMTMPQATDTAGDWTLQWRYYQSHTAAPVNDSSVYVGDQAVLSMDGSKFYTPAGAQIAVIPTGSWNEICIIRSGGKLYYYVNGVYYAAVDDVNYRMGDIRFVFGDQQQTFKYFDELRFSRGALYTPGENYTPTSVPHDSNLALILPTGKDVVVDEVGSLIPSDDNLLTPYKTDDWGSSTLMDYLQRDYTPLYPYTDYVTDGSYEPVWDGYPIVYDRDFITTLTVSSSSPRYRRVSFNGITSVVCASPEASYYAQPKYSIAMPLFYLADDGDSENNFDVRKCSTFSYVPGQIYTFSVVLADYSYSSITFRIVKNTDEEYYVDDPPYVCEILNVDLSSEIQFFLEDDLGLRYHGYDPDTDYTFPVTAICWNSIDGRSDVLHLELVKGNSSQFQIDYDTAVYDETELAHSPTLAVRTDVTITDYQIGGVRPSVPEKGQVWALVESGYITSLQVYNGSVWLNCDGRIWTGQRWIPASSYNVITLQDMYDIVDSTQDYEYIYTESGFWGWLQKAWKDMISRLDKIIEGLNAAKGTSLDSCDHVYDLSGEGEPSCADHGRLVYTCSLCGDVFTELVDPLGHQWPIDCHSASILVQPQDVSAPLRSVVKFSVIAVGDGLAYQWQYRPVNGNGWSNSTIGNPNTDTLSVEAVSSRDGHQYRCKITDSNGKTVISDPAVLTIGDLYQPSYAPPSYSCSRCGVVGEVFEGGIVSFDGVPSDSITVRSLLTGVFDGSWTVVTGVISSGFNGLAGFVESLSVLPDFFALYRPANQAGVFGVQYYWGDDIWD